MNLRDRVRSEQSSKSKEIEPKKTNDTFGWLLTVYKPVYDSNGNCALTGKILCSCGQRYKLSVIRGKRYWVCNNHHLDKKLCQAKSIAEKNIWNAFITMINKLRYIRNPVLTTAIQQTERLNMKCNGTAEKVRTIEKTISELSNKCLVLARLNSKGIIRASEYAEKNGKLTD